MNDLQKASLLPEIKDQCAQVYTLYLFSLLLVHLGGCGGCFSLPVFFLLSWLNLCARHPSFVTNKLCPPQILLNDSV